MNKIKIVFYSLLTSVLPAFSFAQANCPPNGVLCNPLKGNGDLLTYVNSLIDVAIKLGAVVAVLAIIYAGFLFVTAQGEEAKIETAKKVLLYTVIGMLILLGARAISSVITGTVTNIGNATK